MVAYKQVAKKARLKVLDLIYNAQTSHIGSNYSCIDILTVLFDKIDFKKDKIILSAGWKAASLYYFLWKKRRITKKQLNSYCQEDSKFIGLAEPIHPDIPVAGGSMGLGLPMAVGLALAKKVKKNKGTIYVLLSDGEVQIGTFYESLLIAKQNKLDNLVILIDCNAFQAMGKTEEILDIEPLGEKLTSFGWDWNRIDGHRYLVIEEMLNRKPNKGKPFAAICLTTKGKGVSFMEDNNLWHYKAPNEDEYLKAKEELEK